MKDTYIQIYFHREEIEKIYIDDSTTRVEAAKIFQGIREACKKLGYNNLADGLCAIINYKDGTGGNLG